MSKNKKIILAMKVFLPLLIKSIINLWEQVTDAYSEQNQDIAKTTRSIIDDQHFNAK